MNQVEEKKQALDTKKDQSEILLLVSTSKGGFIYYSNPERLVWEINGPHLLGSIIHHMILDHRTNKIKADIKALNYYSVPIITSDIKKENIINVITYSLINIFNNNNELYDSISEIKINNNEIHYTTKYRTTIKLNENNINQNTTTLINFLNQNKVKKIESYEYVNLLIPNQIIVKEKSI